MYKPLFLLAAAALAGAAIGQVPPIPRAPVPEPRPMPPPLLPIVPPPVDHPAYLGQPAMNPEQPPPAPAPGAMPGPAEPDPAEVRAREFLEKRVKGKDLKRAVERVRKELHWYESLDDAKAASAASGKPILWIQALGEIDGFA